MQIFGEVLKGVQKASTSVKTGLSGAKLVQAMLLKTLAVVTTFAEV